MLSFAKRCESWTKTTCRSFDLATLTPVIQAVVRSAVGTPLEASAMQKALVFTSSGLGLVVWAPAFKTQAFSLPTENKTTFSNGLLDNLLSRTFLCLATFRSEQPEPRQWWANRILSR